MSTTTPTRTLNLPNLEICGLCSDVLNWVGFVSRLKLGSFLQFSFSIKELFIELTDN